METQKTHGVGGLMVIFISNFFNVANKNEYVHFSLRIFLFALQNLCKDLHPLESSEQLYLDRDGIETFSEGNCL